MFLSTKQTRARYSLWTIEHESTSLVMAYKEKDTDSNEDIDKWLKQSYFHGASFYRPESELPADYLQLFED